jgi:hypothetical protein
VATSGGESGAELLAVGWVPKDGWRWASDSEMTLKGKEYLVASEKWLQVAEQYGPRWLVPLGAPKWVRIRPPWALRAFLQLGGSGSDLPVELMPQLRLQIADYAARYGWLGRPQPLILTDGGGEVRGEEFKTWADEIVLLGGVSRLLDTCDRIQRSDALPRRGVMAARVEQLTEAATAAGLNLSPAARPDDLIREARRGARAILTPRLRGQFSARLLDPLGVPVERYVPSTLAATLELELARRAVKSDPSQKAWQTCRWCQILFEPKRSDQRSCSEQCRYAFRDAREPRPRGRVA